MCEIQPRFVDIFIKKKKRLQLDSGEILPVKKDLIDFIIRILPIKRIHSYHFPMAFYLSYDLVDCIVHKTAKQLVETSDA